MKEAYIQRPTCASGVFPSQPRLRHFRLLFPFEQGASSLLSDILNTSSASNASGVFS